MCLFEFIRVEGGVNFTKHINGGPSYKSLETSGVFCVMCCTCRGKFPYPYLGIFCFELCSCIFRTVISASKSTTIILVCCLMIQLNSSHVLIQCLFFPRNCTSCRVSQSCSVGLFDLHSYAAFCLLERMHFKWDGSRNSFHIDIFKFDSCFYHIRVFFFFILLMRCLRAHVSGPCHGSGG
jgi:hypothetical protein